MVKLVRLEAEGQEVIINLRPSGRWLGLASAIAQVPYNLTAITLTKCELQRVAINDFLQLVRNDAQFSWQMLQACSRSLIAFNVRLTQMATSTARQRLEQLLWQLLTAQGLDETGKEVRLIVPLMNKEIAQAIAVSPGYVSELLKQMKTEGVLRQRGMHEFVIARPQQLWHEPDVEMM